MTHGLFIAVFPDPPAAREIASRIAGLKTRHGLTGRPLRDDRFHVSLCGLGEWLEPPPARRVAAATAALAEIDYPAFAVQIEYARSYNQKAARHAFVLFDDKGMDGIREVRALLVQALARRGVKTAPDFDPHLTLLYDQRLIPEHPIEPIRWTVREIVLVESLRGQGRYIRRGDRALG